MKHYLIFCLIGVLLTACGTDNQAPVEEGWRQPMSKQGTYIVQPGDSLYAVAWRYGYDHRELIRSNHIKPPYHIYPGQKITFVDDPSITSGRGDTQGQQREQKDQQPTLVAVLPPATKLTRQQQPSHLSTQSARLRLASWVWPTQGQIVKPAIHSDQNNHGIDIRGKVGQIIVASQRGEVVYSGNGLRGYGNLIIIKHTQEYLSAYAYNQINLVREGQQVQKGQKIALMGKLASNPATLHFEIRRAGKPIEPMVAMTLTNE